MIKTIIGIIIALCIWALACWKVWDLASPATPVTVRQVQTQDIPLPGPEIKPEQPAAPATKAEPQPVATAPRQAKPKVVAKATRRPVIRVVRKSNAPAALPPVSARLFGEAPTSINAPAGN